MGNFKETQLGSIGQFSKGSGISKDSVVDDGEYNAIRYAELYTTYGIIIKDIMSHVNHKDIKSSKQIQYGDILIAGSGEELIDIGKTAVYSLNEPCYVGGDTVIFRPDKNQNGIYLGYLLNTQNVIKQRMKYGQGNSIVHIYTRDLQKIKISIPSLEEQKAIVSVIEKWEKYIEQLDKKILIKKNIKKYLQQVLLTGEVRLEGFKEDWREFELEEVCKVLKGRGLSKELLDENGEMECILYGELYTKYNEIIDTVVSHTNVEEGIKSTSGDVLIPASTTTNALDVATASCLKKSDVLLGGDINIFRPSGNIDGEFLAQYLSHTKKIQMAKLAQGITIVHLYGKDVKKLKIRIPEIEEQKAISFILFKSEVEITMLEKQRDIIEEQRKYLLNNLVTGEIRLPKFRSNK